MTVLALCMTWAPHGVKAKMAFRQSLNGCPANPDEVADHYWTARLTTTEAVAFEEHVRTCPRCAAISSTAEEYVRAMKTVLRRYRQVDDHSAQRAKVLQFGARSA